MIFDDWHFLRPPPEPFFYHRYPGFHLTVPMRFSTARTTRLSTTSPTTTKPPPTTIITPRTITTAPTTTTTIITPRTIPTTTPTPIPTTTPTPIPTTIPTTTPTTTPTATTTTTPRKRKRKRTRTTPATTTTSRTLTTTTTTTSASLYSAQIPNRFENIFVNDVLKGYENTSVFINHTPVIRDTVDYHSNYTNILTNLMIDFTLNNQRHFLMSLIIFSIFLIFTVFIIAMLMKIARYYHRNRSSREVNHYRLNKNADKNKRSKEHRIFSNNDHEITNALDYDISSMNTWSTFSGHVLPSSPSHPTPYTTDRSIVPFYENIK